jgi:hypothetical protein
MPVKTLSSVYHFAEEIEVLTEGVTPVVCRTLSPGETVEKVMARIKTPAVRAGGATTFSVGDDDAATGFLLAADVKAAAGTLYGTVPTERGAYLYDDTVKAGYLKSYTAMKDLKIVLSAAPDTEAVVQVTVIGHHIPQG